MCLLRLLGFILTVLFICWLITLLGCEQPVPQNDPAPPPKIDQGCTPPKVVAFCADWCGPCQAAQPKLKWLESQGVEVVHVNVDQRRDLCREYQVTSYPTFFVYICHKPDLRTQDIDEVLNACYWLKDKQHGQDEEVP